MRTEPRRRTAPGYSPESLSEYFAGLWDLRRTIEDRRRGETGSLRGEAEFRTEPSGLSYRENGALEIGAYRGRAHQGYLFLFPAPARLEVRFQDRRLFHRADLSSGMASRLRPYDLFWLEEPIFPPEDFRALARLRTETGVPLAAGENACTAFQFQEMFTAGAVDYAQPSVTKVGGITEFRKVAALAETDGVALMPHAPYFGPGFLASLQLMAALPRSGLAEWFYLDREACLYGESIAPRGGVFHLPAGPGLGAEPNLDVIRDYRAT